MRSSTPVCMYSEHSLSAVLCEYRSTSTAPGVVSFEASGRISVNQAREAYTPMVYRNGVTVSLVSFRPQRTFPVSRQLYKAASRPSHLPVAGVFQYPPLTAKFRCTPPHPPPIPPLHLARLVSIVLFFSTLLKLDHVVPPPLLSHIRSSLVLS